MLGRAIQRSQSCLLDVRLSVSLSRWPTGEPHYELELGRLLPRLRSFSLDGDGLPASVAYFVGAQFSGEGQRAPNLESLYVNGSMHCYPPLSLYAFGETDGALRRVVLRGAQSPLEACFLKGLHHLSIDVPSTVPLEPFEGIRWGQVLQACPNLVTLSLQGGIHFDIPSNEGQASSPIALNALRSLSLAFVSAAWVLDRLTAPRLIDFRLDVTGRSTPRVGPSLVSFLRRTPLGAPLPLLRLRVEGVESMDGTMWITCLRCVPELAELAATSSGFGDHVLNELRFSTSIETGPLCPKLESLFVTQDFSTMRVLVNFLQTRNRPSRPTPSNSRTVSSSSERSNGTATGGGSGGLREPGPRQLRKLTLVGPSRANNADIRQIHLIMAVSNLTDYAGSFAIIPKLSPWTEE